LFFSKAENEIETGAGGGETTNSLITSASQGRLGGSQCPPGKPLSKNGLN